MATLLALAGCLTGCALFDASRPLRTQQPPPPGAAVACMEALATGILEADPGDPRLVWLIAGAERVDLAWPVGFRVRFTPQAEVLSPSGDVLLREGETVRLGGGTVTDVFEVCTINGVTWLTTEVVVPILP